jgi:hypothetical protein
LQASKIVKVVLQPSNLFQWLLESQTQVQQSIVEQFILKALCLFVTDLSLKQLFVDLIRLYIFASFLFYKVHKSIPTLFGSFELERCSIWTVPLPIGRT